MISVIIPVYNGERTIKRAVSSVQNQTYKDVEIIVISDGSTDRTVSIIEEIKKNDNRVKLIQIKNKGPSHARNIGITRASGEYIAFLDADDYMREIMLEKLYYKIQQENVCCCFCNYTTEDENKELINVTCFSDKLWSKEEIIKNLIPSMVGKLNEVEKQDVILGVVWRGLYKKAVLENFNEMLSYGEDLIWLIGLLKRIDSCYTIENYLYCYQIGRLSLTNGRKPYDASIWEKRNTLNKMVNREANGLFDERRIQWRVRVSALECVSILMQSKCSKEKKKEFMKVVSDETVKNAFAHFRSWSEVPFSMRYLYACLKYKCWALTVLYYQLVKIKHKAILER